MNIRDLFRAGLDNTAQFQSLVQSCAGQGTEIDLGGETYSLRGPIQLFEGSRLRMRNGLLLFLPSEDWPGFCVSGHPGSLIDFQDVSVIDKRGETRPKMSGIMEVMSGRVRVVGGEFSEFDNYGIFIHESEMPEVSGVEFTGHGTAVQLSGCRYGLIQHSVAYECGFAFSVIGKEYTDNAESGFYLPVVVDVEWSIGNLIFACHADYCRGTSFNVNGSNAGTVLACTDSNNMSEHPSFQIKHPKNAERTRFNKIALCHVENSRTGYYTQGSRESLFLGDSSSRSKNYGVRLNWTEQSLVLGCFVDQYGGQLLENEKAVIGGIAIRNSIDCLVDVCFVAPDSGNEESGRLANVSIEKSSGIDFGQMVGYA